MKVKNIKILMFLTVIIMMFTSISVISASDITNLSQNNTHLELHNTTTHSDYSTVETSNNYIKNNQNKSLNSNIDEINRQNTTSNQKISKNDKNLKSEEITIGNSDFYNVQADYSISGNGGKTVTLEGNVNYGGYDRSLKYTITSSLSTLNIDGSTNTLQLNEGDTLTINSEGKYFFFDLSYFQMAMVLNTDHSKKLSNVYTSIDLPATFNVPTTGTYKFYLAGSFSHTTLETLGPEIWFGTSYKEIIESPEEPDNPTPTEVALTATDVTIKNGETGTIAINTDPIINQGTVTVTDANGNTVATVNLANSNTFNYQANAIPGTIVTLTYVYEDSTNTYTASGTTSKITITKRDSITTSQPTSTNVGEVKVSVTIVDEDGTTPITNGTVNILNGNTVIATATLSGTNTVEIPLDLPAGTYNLVTNYTGNNYHITSIDESGLENLVVNENSVKPEITVNVNGIYAGEFVNISGTVSVDNDYDLEGSIINITLTTTDEVINDFAIIQWDESENIYYYVLNDFTIGYKTVVNVSARYIRQANLDAYEENPEPYWMDLEELELVEDSDVKTVSFEVIKVPLSFKVDNMTTLVNNSVRTYFNLSVNAPIDLVNNINGYHPTQGILTLIYPDGTEEEYDVTNIDYVYYPNVSKNGTFIYTVKYSDDKNMYENIETTFKVVVNNIATSIELNVEDIYVGQAVNISGKLISNDESISLEDKTITLTIDGTGYVAFTNQSGEFTFDQIVMNNVVENIPVTAKFNASQTLADSDIASNTFNVLALPVEISTDEDSITTKINDQNTFISIILEDTINHQIPSSGKIIITKDNKQFTTLYLGGDDDLILYPDTDTNGTFEYKIEYVDENGKYLSDSTTVTVIVDTIESTITVNAEDIYVGQNVSITGSLKANIADIEDKIISIKIGENTYYTTTDEKGYFELSNVTMNSAKNNVVVSAIFNKADGLSTSNEATDSFNVKLIPVEVGAEGVTVNAKDDVQIPIDLTDTINEVVPSQGTVTVMLNGVTVKTLDATDNPLEFTPDTSVPGTYTYTITYADGIKYDTNTIDITVTVNTISTEVTVDALDIFADEYVNITGSLTTDGEPLAHQEVVVTVKGIQYRVTTNVTGQFVLNNFTIDAAENNIAVSAVFNENLPYTTSNTAQTTFNVKLIPVDIKAESITVNAKDNIQIPIDLTDTINKVVPNQGTVTITLNGQTIATLDATDNPLEFTPDTTTPGTYTYTITYTDGTKYDTNNIDITVNINTIPTQITLDTTDIYAGQYVNITGSLTANNEPLTNQEVTITIKDTQYKVTTNTTGQFILNNFTIDAAENNIPITAIFNENLPYTTSNTAQTTFNVKNVEVELKTENKTTKVGDDVIITIIVTDKNSDTLPSQGTIIVTDKDGAIIATLDVTKDDLKFSHDAVLDGIFEYVVSFVDNENKYQSASTVSKVTVNKLDTAVSSENKTVLFGEDVVVPIVVKDENGNVPTMGTVEVIRDNTSIKTFDISKDVLEFTHVADSNGEFIYTIKYSADNNYESSQTTQKVTVNNKEVTLRFIEVTDTIVGKTNSIKVELTDGDNKISNEYVTINVDGKNYIVKTDSNGIATLNTFKSKVERKDVPVVASYPGNDTTGYKKAETIEDAFNVNKVDTIITINPIDDAIYSENVTITGTLTNVNGEVLARYPVVLNLNGLNYTVKTDKDGKYSFNVKSSLYNKNNVTISYNGDSKYNPTNNTSNFNVNRKATRISVDSINSTVYGNQLNITGKLTDSDNNGLSNSNVQIIVNNISYTVKTDKNGNYRLTINSNKLDVNNVSIGYDGDDKYLASNTTTSFNVTAKPTELTVEVSDSNVGDPASINITLNDNAGKPVTDKVNVTINQNTKEYSINNGKLSIEYIPTSANPVNVTVSYNGNSNNGYANASNKSAIINVDKHPTKVTVDSAKSIVGDKFTLVAHVVDEEGNPVNGGSLVFKVNGLTLREDGKFGSNAKPLKLSVVNGIVQYTLTADLYLRHAKNVTATYSGSSKYYANRTETFAPIEIALRNANVKVTLNPSKAKQNETITITTTITDITPNSDNNNFLDSDDDYVFLKLNGKTFKDDEGNVIKVNVTRGVAVYNYTVPRAMAGIKDNVDRNYTITAGFSSKNYYPDSRSNATFNVERSPINITLTKATFNNQKLSIKGTIKDDLGLNVIGSNKICIKINGLTYMINNQTQYYSVNDGVVDLSVNLISQISSVDSVQIVTGDRQAYLGNRSNVLEL